MRIATASLILMAGSLGSRLLGLVREQIIAALYGRTRETDLFTAAARVPTTLYDLLVGGVVTAALVPVITNYLEENPKEAGRLIGTLLILVAAVLGLVTVSLWVFALPLAEVILPGYRPEDRALAGQLLRLMAPVLPCLSLGGVLAGVSVARRQFVFPSLGAAVLNLAFGLSAVFFRPLGVAALAVSFTVGAVAHSLWQAGGLRGVKISPELDLNHPGLRRFLRLYIPVFLGLLVSTAGVGFDTYLASFTGAGDLTAMRFATNIIQFAIGFVGGSIGLAALPTLTRQAAAETTRADYEATLTAVVRWVWLLTWGLAVVMLVVRRPLVGLLFERGQFGAADTDRTALALLAYLPGLPAAALDQQLIYAFYARQDTLTPVLVGVLAVGLYAATAVALLGPLGMPGLALANSTQWLVHAAVMVWLARPLLGNGLRPLGDAAARGLVAGAAGAGAAAALSAAVPALPGRTTAYLWEVAVGGGAGLAAYWLILYLLRTPEAALFKARVAGLVSRVVKLTD